MELKVLQIREGNGDAITSPASIAQSMSEEGKADRELFWVLHLNTAHKIIDKELVAMGTLNQANIHPREVFRKAILNSSCCVITAHNHPGGVPEPSDNDIKTWTRLRQAGDIIGIEVIDNIILTPNGKYYSQADRK